MLLHKACQKLFLVIVVLCLRAIPVFPHGDKVIPQVFDGAGVGRTKFDITNLSPEFPITKVTVLFFRQDGSAWSVATNMGTATGFTLTLGPFQTLRVETTGASPSTTVGYAIVRNTERSTNFAEDYEVAITVFYEIRSGPNIIDTVSVPTGQPTVSWAFPVEIDETANLLTGFAIVNLAEGTNSVNLWLYAADTQGSSVPPPNAGMTTITLNSREQRSQFLNQSGLFPGRTRFKGMLLGFASRPVSVLALLQTGTPGGVQYATLTPAYQDALRKNNSIYLRQGLPFDADLLISDYTGNSRDTAPWDLLYETQSTTARRLVPRSGAMFAVIGQRSDSQFDDDVTLEFLQGLTYSETNIDLSNASSNLMRGFSFAIRTGLGRYAKVRIAEVITQGNERQLALESEVYR